MYLPAKSEIQGAHGFIGHLHYIPESVLHSFKIVVQQFFVSSFEFWGKKITLEIFINKHRFPVALEKNKRSGKLEQRVLQA